ncbi:MAG: hypothetical protein HRU48_02840 [Vibrio sp.]|uniref:hypothetical protein n=1 Tax=Vibrio TaxID=662 RepID=UPI001EC9D8A6|nr:hypothetical protein [Vibrio sp.]NRB66295.1 hypothetical protein [Vibrio sp.]
MKPQIIPVNLQDKASLQQALETFQSHLQAVYKTGQLINQVGGFVSHDNRLFQTSDLQDPEQIQAMARFGSINDPGFEQMERLSELELEQLNRSDVYLKFSHVTVFQHALADEAFKPLVLRICQNLVEFSIRVNSSNELFFSSSSIFGTYLLVLLAEKYPEYAYLIGEFVPPNGDYHQLGYHCTGDITYLFDKYGYDPMMLDILASTRCPNLMSAMAEGFSDWSRFRPNLLKCFLADEQKYQYFVQALKASLTRRPVDTQSLWLSEELESCFDEMMDDAANQNEEWDEDDQEFGELDFHGRPMSEVLEALDETLFELVKDVPLAELYYYSEPVYEGVTLGDTRDDPFYQEYNEDSEYETNKAFFLEGFDNGEKILAYIEHSQCPEVLDELVPTNIRKLARDKKLYIFKRFEYFGSGGFELSEQIDHDVELSDILERFFVAYLNPELFGIVDDGEAEQDQKCLRTLDVLVRLLGKKELSGSELKEVVEEFELCSKKDAVKRYTLKALNKDEIKDRVYGLINEDTINTFGRARLEELHDFFKRDEALFGEMLDEVILRAYQDTDPDILAVTPGLNQIDYARGTQLLSVAYILCQEANSFTPSEHLGALAGFYSEHVFKSFYREMAQHHELDCDEKAQALSEKIKAYVESQASGGNSLFAKLMKQEPAAQAVSKDEALACIRELLASPDEETGTLHSDVFVVSDDVGMILASMLYAAKVAPAPLKKQLLALYGLMLELFPAKTLLVSFYEFSESGVYTYQTTNDEIEAFCDFITDLGINEKYAFLLRIVMIQKAQVRKHVDGFNNDNGLRDAYLRLLNRYRKKDEQDPNEPEMLARKERKISEAISAAVDLLDDKHRQRFLGFAYPGFDEAAYNVLVTAELVPELAAFFSDNTDADEAECEALVHALMGYLIGELSLADITPTVLTRLNRGKPWDYTRNICATLLCASDARWQKLLAFLFASDNLDNIDDFFDILDNKFPDGTENEPKRAAEMVRLITQAGLEGELAYAFYLRQFEAFDTDWYFDENPFTPVILRHLEEIQTSATLTSSEAYDFFMREKEENQD